MRRGICLLLLIGLLCCLQCGGLDPLVLRPSATIRRLPTELGYSFEARTVPTPGGSQISLWHVFSSVQRKGIIVLVPGNDANKGRYTTSLPIFVDNGWDMVLPDYAGFGESPGMATLEALFDSTYAAIDYAKSQSDVVIGYGVSLGTAVLARVAVDRELTACVFESTVVFHEAPSLVAKKLGIYTPLMDIIDFFAAVGSPEGFDTKRWIQQVREPKLFIHSPDDHVTPFDGAWEVFKLAPPPKHMFVTQGEHALQVFMDPNLYRSVVNGWLDGVLNQDPIENELFRQILQEEINVAFEALGLTPPPLNSFGGF